MESVDGRKKLEAADEEEHFDPQRLELLAVVRGLEALDEPSRVTLVTRHHSISRGFRFGLANWRENDWQWECYGRMTDVKDADLWQRVDRALRYHDVNCRTWRFDSQHESAKPTRSRGRRLATSDRQIASRPSLLSRVGALFTMPGRAREAAARLAE
ncbi:MAG: hypothetical protein CMJ64_21935 [Planctomycetaceae bacterium]|nr:hypothetical protein [Planctomycetaceae bacterium]